MFRVKGNQPPLRVIFRGKDKRISEDEKDLAPEYPCILPTQCMDGCQCSQRMGRENAREVCQR